VINKTTADTHAAVLQDKIATCGTGQALPPAIGQELADFFGADFSTVRLHYARWLRGSGYTALACGERIFLDPDVSSFGTRVVREILAHELTHILQQRSHTSRNPAYEGFRIIVDATMEAEAEQMGRQCGATLTAHVDANLPAAYRTAEATRDISIAQPVIVVKTKSGMICYGKHIKLPESVKEKMHPEFKNQEVRFIAKKVGSEKNAGWNATDTCWNELLNDPQAGPIITALANKEFEKARTKLGHWINADPRATLPGVKAHHKQFRSYEELARALSRRVSSTGSKAIEGELAKAIMKSESIRLTIRNLIEVHLCSYHKQLGHWEEFQERERYAFFYSPATSGVIKKQERTVLEGLAYIIKNQNVTITEMCSFLCDYSLCVRDYLPDEELNIPNQDARFGHFNVNESSKWVREASEANIRLGAGPSATTANVMRLIQVVTGDMNSEVQKELLTYTAWGLFAMWNYNKKAMQTKAEIHTYHEVMIVALAYGAKAFPSSSNASNEKGQFEYPSASEIPR